MCDAPYLREVDAFPVSQRDDLIKGEDDLKGVVQDVRLLQGAAVLGDHSGKETDS